MTNWDQQFRDFERRKERAAIEAEFFPYATEIDRAAPPLQAITDPWSAVLFDGAFYQSPASAAVSAANLVFVQSRNGNTGADDPVTLGGGVVDKHLIYEGLSRVMADAVLVGAETARGGDFVFSVWHPEMVRLRAGLGRSRHPIQIVGTLRGFAIAQALLFNLPDVPVIVLTIPSGVDAMREALRPRPWITPLVMKDASDLPFAFRELQRMGVNRVSAVGGRTMAAALLDAGLVQDLYLTTSPRPGGEPDTPLYPRPLNASLILRKRGTGPETGVVFEHFVVG